MKEGFLVVANDNFNENRIPEPEQNPILNEAVAVSLESTIQSMRDSGEHAYIFNDLRMHKDWKEASNFSREDAINMINLSVKAQWEGAPIFYLALLEKARSPK